MATIKSYSDLQQSKKLAEFLPLESADMFWKNGVSDKYIQCFTPFVMTYTNVDYDYDVPCWSLAALLNEIPEVINFNDDENDYALKILKENGLYYLSYDNPLEHGKIEIEPQENFIDAGYEMIIKLHELNLL